MLLSKYQVELDCKLKVKIGEKFRDRLLIIKIRSFLLVLTFVNCLSICLLISLK